MNTIFVPILCNGANPADKAFLESRNLVHSAVPRFYILSPTGEPLSMSVGMVDAPPMGPTETLKRVAGRSLPVDAKAAAKLGQRIRTYS